MCLKNKIIAVFLGVCIAGVGIAGINVQTAQAVETDTTQATQTNLSIEQLEAIVKSLQQQIQQMIALIARLKPLETCGNDICRFGETAASCPADCDKTTNDNGKSKCSATGGIWKYSTSIIPTCISLTKESRLLTEKFLGDCGGAGGWEKGYECVCPSGEYWGSREEGCITRCGNNICETSETAATCPVDCKIAACAKEGEIAYWNTSVSSVNKCCNELTPILDCASSNDCSKSANSICTKCGNGTCGTGENSFNCPADCATANNCLKEGQSGGYAVTPSGIEAWNKNPQKCCAGLDTISTVNRPYNGACQLTAGYSGFICTRCGDGFCNNGENFCNCQKDCAMPACKKDGESIGLTTDTNPGRYCCSGLTAINTGWSYGCSAYSDVKCTSAICGNGTCETAKGEDECNCKTDCGAISQVNRGYKEFGGKCTITNVSATDASPDGYLGSANVNFTFTPSVTPDISGTFLTSSASINPYKGSTSASYLGLYCLEGPYEPTYAQTLRCGVTVGAIFDCALTVSTGGSGTPINIRFIDDPACAKEGEYQTSSGNVVKKCCSGLATYISLNTTESSVANSNLLCYNPAKNTPTCKNAGTANAGFYYPDNSVVRYERCVDRNACNPSLNANDCRAAGGNFFADQKCYCNY